jgi:hypothetical protein
VTAARDRQAAELTNRAPRVDLTGVGKVTPPYASAHSGIAWVAEGTPIPVGMGTLAAAPAIVPRKIAMIDSISREAFETSPAGSESWMETLLRDLASAGLDQSLFSNTAAIAVAVALIAFDLTGACKLVHHGGAVPAALVNLTVTALAGLLHLRGVDAPEPDTDTFDLDGIAVDHLN